MITLFSPAKVNLFLSVLRKREDGYHDLASLFQAIDLGDQLSFSLANEDQLICPDGAPNDQTNLVWKAVKLFREKSGIAIPLKMTLKKSIPMQAGLGGGSSNAATTLWALNELSGRPATLEQLIDWSGEIGSDITFFLSLGTAYCTGRGEKISPLPSLPDKMSQQPMYIVKPQEGLSTPAVFKQLELSNLRHIDIEELLKNYYEGRPDYFNDLEAAAFQLNPTLGKLKIALQQSGFETVVMTGSGTSFLCIGNGKIPDCRGVISFQVHFIRRESGAWY